MKLRHFSLPDALAVSGNLFWLLEGNAERLGAHRGGSGLQVCVGLAHLLDLVLALDVAAERSLEHCNKGFDVNRTG